jgi:hypothetical protein
MSLSTSIVAGNTGHIGHHNALHADYNDARVWTTYTPTITSADSTVEVNLGAAGYIAGRYSRVGDRVVCHWVTGFGGSGQNPSTGTYFWSPPVAIRAHSTYGYGYAYGAAMAYDDSEVAFYAGAVVGVPVGADGVFTMYLPAPAGSATPFTPSSNDTYTGGATYPAATSA